MRQRDQFTRTARLGLLLGWLWAGAAAAGPAPGWFADHLAELTADGGVWIADNAAYRSEQEKAEGSADDADREAGDHPAEARRHPTPSVTLVAGPAPAR